jgi:DNA (cytosine-5)-methyltransferase 1
MRACDYGTPPIRKRFFLVARRDSRGIVWPKPTHGNPKTPAVQAGQLLPWRTAAECINWDLACPSIFERSKPLAEATLRRIAKGIMRYVVNAADPFIVGQGGPVYSGKPVTVHQPFGTLTTENHRALVAPTLVQVGYGEREGQAPRALNIGKPLGTVVSGAAKHALASAFLSPYYSDKTEADARGSLPDEPVKTIPTENRHALVTAFLSEHANASGQRVMPADEPLRTVCAQVKGGHFSMVSAFLAKHYTGVVGSDLADPIGTVTSTDHHSLVTSNLVKLRGTSTAAGTDEPLGTVSAGGQHHAEVRAFLLKYYSTDQDPRLGDPLHTVTTKDRYGLVTIHGQDYQIVDIGLRMLAPRELYRAQGFSDDYVIGDDPEQGLKLTKSAQVRMAGNSVCPPLARALIEANFAHEREIVRAA